MYFTNLHNRRGGKFQRFVHLLRSNTLFLWRHEDTSSLRNALYAKVDSTHIHLYVCACIYIYIRETRRNARTLPSIDGHPIQKEMIEDSRRKRTGNY